MEANENKKEDNWISVSSEGYKWFEWNVTEKWNNAIAKITEVKDPILVLPNGQEEKL